MRFPPVNGSSLAVAGLLVAGGFGTGLAIVLLNGSGPSYSLGADPLASTSPTPYQTSDVVTPSPTPAVALTPTASPTPTLAPSPTATPAVTGSPTPRSTRRPSATPSPTRTKSSEPQTVTAQIVDGPGTVYADRQYTYTYQVTWTHQRPAYVDFGVDKLPSHPAAACPAHPAKPAQDGPGRLTVQRKVTFTGSAASHRVMVRATTSCQYYTGAGSGDRKVVVYPSPSPTPAPSAS